MAKIKCSYLLAHFSIVYGLAARRRQSWDFHIENFNNITIKIYVFEAADYEFQGFEGVACKGGGRALIFCIKFSIFNSNFFIIRDIDF